MLLQEFRLEYIWLGGNNELRSKVRYGKFTNNEIQQLLIADFEDHNIENIAACS